jgi:hypothetical protein
MTGSTPVTISTDDTMITALDTSVDIIAGDTTSLDSKVPAKGTAIMTGSTPMTIATDDTMITALDTAVDIIAGDTTSLDGKLPVKGTAAMVGSLPVTISSDDTLITALDVALDSLSAKFVTGTDIGDVTINNTAGSPVYVYPGTSANMAQETGGNLATIAGKDFATQTTLAAANASLTTIAAFTCNTGAVAGSVTANAGTNLNTSLLATETTLAAANASLTTIAAFTCNTGAVTVSAMPNVTIGTNAALVTGSAIIGRIGGGTTSLSVAGASGANLLAAGGGSDKHTIWKIYIVTGVSESITLSDSCGVFKSDANGVFVFDWNPVGKTQGTAATAITITTGAASAWTAEIIYSDAP